MSRIAQAEGLLRALDAIDAGEPAPRRMSKPPRVRKLKQGLCRKGCGVQIIVAPGPGGNWCCLDSHPAGDMTIVRGVVRAYADIMGAVPRYVWHKCEVKS